MSEEPIRIVDIHEVNGRPRFKLVDDLKDILDLAGNHEICLISIAGASRLGKSCFLSYLIHHLAHLENGTKPIKDWLPPNSPNKVLGFPYKNTVERQTTGFWMWPKPFLIPGKDHGQKVAVFVMDTQGVFDERTMTEWSAIFGLALLTSGILIYNLHFNPQEDCLIILDTFLQYGLMTRAQPSPGSEEVAPFQKLFCLIRDWNSAGSYPYGSLGGKQYVDKWISTENKSNLRPDAIQRRKNIKNCFEKIQGFLLPHPGTKAQSDRFEGATADLDPEFYRHIKDCVERLCNPEHLVINKINSRNATAQDLFALFKNYVKILDRPEIPGAIGYLEATYQASCDGAKENALILYKEKIDKILHSKDVIPLDELTLKIDQAGKEAVHLFDQKNKLGSQGISKTTKAKLVEEIKWSRSKIIQDVLSNLDAVLESLIHETEAKFTTEFNKLFAQQKYDEIGIPSKEIETALKNISAIVAESFDSNPALENEELAEKFATSLDEKLIVLRANYRQKNSEKLAEFEFAITQATIKLIEGYRQEFEDSITYLPFLEEEKFSQLNLKCRQNALGKLDKFPVNQLPQNIRPHALSRLEEKLDQEFAEKKKNNTDAITKAKEDLEELVSQTVDTFKQQFAKFISKAKTTPSQSQLEFEFMKRRGEANDHFLIQSLIADLKFTNPYKILLGQKIQTAYDEILKGLAENVEVLEGQVNNWMESQRSDFKKEMAQHQSKIPYLELEDFQQLCRTTQSELVSRTEIQLKNLGIPEPSRISQLQALTRNLEKMSETLSQEHEKMLHQEIIKGRASINQSVDKYLQLMKSQPTNSTSSKSLDNLHHTSLAKVENAVSKTWSHLPSSILNTLKSELGSNVETAFHKLQEQLDTERQEKADKVQQAIHKAANIYGTRMEKKWKLEHLDEKELKEQSEFCKKLAIRTFENDTNFFVDSEDSDLQKLDLADTIDNLFAGEIAKFRQMKKSSRETQICQHVQSCGDSYSNKMKRHLQGQIGDSKWFENCHKACQIQAWQAMSDYAKASGISLTPEESDKSENEIKTLIQKSYQPFLQEFKNAQASMEEKLAGYEILAVAEHSAKIQHMANELLLQDDDILNAEHQKLENEKIEYLQTHFATINPTHLANAIHRLTTAFDNSLVKIKDEYAKKFIKFSQILSSLENAIKKDLEEADDPDWEEISRQHNNRRDTAFKDLENLCNFPTQQLTTDFENQYHSSVKKIYDDNKTNFVIHEPEPAILNPILIELCKHYEEEMKKHTPSGSGFTDPNQLKMDHNQVAQHVTERLKERKSVKMTALVKSKIKLKLNALLKKREEENFKNATTTEVAIGIDLGTTFSCVAIYDKDLKGTKVLENAQGKTTTPSYIRIHGGEEVVGDVAKTQAFTYPSNTIFDAKRLIGRQFDDPVVQADIRNWPFTVIPDPAGNGNPLIEVDGQTFEPEAISAKILAKLKKDAEDKIGKPISSAVITVPAYFNDGQRQATKDAGMVAGFKVLELLNEPTAAAVGYSLEHSVDQERCVLIFDLGGGTFDVAILSISEGNVQNLAVDGDTHLGGEDFDGNLMDYCIQKFSQINPTANALQGKDSPDHTLKEQLNRRLRRLRNACEDAKIVLSSATVTTVAIAAFFVDGPIALDLNVEVARDEFEHMNETLFKKCIQMVENTITAAKIKKLDIDEIVLVGGSTKIPKVQKMLMAFFGGKALNKKLNPDEAVARGAAIRAAVLNGHTELKSTLVDVTPLSIGIKVMGGDLSVIIPRNTIYPTSRMKQYGTADADQEEVEIVIFEGEDAKASANHLLGTFTLTGIPPGPAESQVVDVTMSVDRDGILTVTAKCEGNGVTKTLTIQEERTRMSEERRELLRARQQTG